MSKVILTEAFWFRQYEDGLNESIKRYLAPVTSLQQVNFYQLVQVTMKVQNSEMSNQERNQKVCNGRLFLRLNQCKALLLEEEDKGLQ